MGSERKDAKKQWRKEEIQGDEEMEMGMNQDLLDTVSLLSAVPRIRPLHSGVESHSLA